MRELVIHASYTDLPNLTEQQVYEAHMWNMKADMGIWRKVQTLAFTYGQKDR